MDSGPALELLAQRAGTMRSYLPFAARPFVIEFAGTPKAGKSTSVDAVQHFFRRNKFRTHVLRERASFCPIPMKGHLFFNTWCACTMLAELLENMETECDIIIKDRGLFDTLLWLQRQIKRGEVTEEEVDRLERFMLMDRWTRMVDMVVVTTVAPDEAMERENGPRISLVAGSVMNLTTLDLINEALTDTLAKYSSSFRFIKSFDTTGRKPRETNIEIANFILDTLEEFLNPLILVIDRRHLEKIPVDGGGCFAPQAEGVLRHVLENSRFVRRSDAETSDSMVQIVPCALLAHKGRLFLFERAEKDPKSDLHGRRTVWQGAHVPKREGVAVEGLVAEARSSKLRDRLFLSRDFKATYLGYAWEKGVPSSDKHLGLLYRLDLESDDVAVDLEKKEFRSGRGYGLSGQFFTPAELKEKNDELRLEPWSSAALAAGVELGA